jgi:hypothetical protein
MPKEVNLVVHPAESPRNLMRVQLLPPLLDSQPGECLALVDEALKTLKETAPPGELRVLEDEIREDGGKPHTEADAKRLAANLAKVKKTLDLLEKAALAQRCDWSKVTEDLRTKGIGATLEFLQHFRRMVPLLAARARLEILQDRPEDAIHSLSLGFRLCQRCGECPTLIGHLVAVAIATIIVEQLDLAIAHPKCPNLYWAMTAVPRPLFGLRAAMEGERSGAYGTFPALFKFVLNPNGPLPTEEEMKQFARAGETTFSQLGVKFGQVERVALGVLIQAKHEAAIKFLADAGFPVEKMRQWPPLLVAIVHGLVEYEERLGEMQLAMDMPYWQAIVRLDELEKELKDRSTTKELKAPAIHLSRLLLPAVGKVMMAGARIERRFAALRTVEALRLHASRTGSWPKTLAEISVPVPDDPASGKPFEYTVEGDMVTLHGPRVSGKESPLFELYYRLRLKGRP